MLAMQGTQVGFLVREVRSHMPQGNNEATVQNKRSPHAATREAWALPRRAACWDEDPAKKKKRKE